MLTVLAWIHILGAMKIVMGTPVILGLPLLPPPAPEEPDTVDLEPQAELLLASLPTRDLPWFKAELLDSENQC